MLKESKTLEFKKEMSDIFLKTVSAFSNFDVDTNMWFLINVILQYTVFEYYW